jgi:UDP:flavonoid glycosyltransferase YjiC (YdhE family)
MWLGKPMLVMPEHCVEQRMNANALVKMGLGMRVEQGALSAAHLHDFFMHHDAFAARMRQHKRDGLAESVQAMEQFIEELAPSVVTPLRAASTPTQPVNMNVPLGNTRRTALP